MVPFRMVSWIQRSLGLRPRFRRIKRRKIAGLNHGAMSGQVIALETRVLPAGTNIVDLNTDTAHLEVARAVVEAAYAAGAAWVEPVWTDGPMRRSAVDHADLENLRRSRPWALQRIREWHDQGAASITLQNFSVSSTT